MRSRDLVTGADRCEDRQDSNGVLIKSQVVVSVHDSNI